MAKGEKRKAEKVKRVRLMKRHRDAIPASGGRWMSGLTLRRVSVSRGW